MIITYAQARNLIVCDVKGIQIEHVKAVDPDAGWVETWSTYENHPDHKSVWVEDGKVVERDYMLARVRSCDGTFTYLSRVHKIDYDVVDKRTGEVVYEVRQYRPEFISSADERP